MRRRVHWSWVVVFIAAALGVGFASAVPGCGDGLNGAVIFTCTDQIPDRIAHDGRPDPCCDIDPCDEKDSGADVDAGAEDAESDGGPPCRGACVAGPPLDWLGPTPVWFGPPGSEPECPDDAPIGGFDAFEGVEADAATCACICTPSSGGTCGLTTTFTASSAICYGAPAVLTSFDAPAGWDGSCTTFDAIPAGALCNGVPCVRSLTAAALVVTSEPTSCVPLSIEPLVDIAPPSVKASVRVCSRSAPPPSCGAPTLACAPSAPPEFKTCIVQAGEQACPTWYPDKHVVAKGFVDDRYCTACSCGAPSGGFCTAMLSVFTDGACGSELLSTQITSSSSACYDITLPGVPLGSKSTTDLQYVPGSCAVTGGASVGGVTTMGTATLCCLP